MPVLLELGTYLEGLGLGTLAEDLFLGGLPLEAPNLPAQDNVAALVTTPGFPPDYIHDEVTPSREYPVIQLLVRGAPYDYATPEARAQAMWLALGQIRNMSLSGVYYLLVTPLQSIFKLREDDYGRLIMTAQFRCDKAVE